MGKKKAMSCNSCQPTAAGPGGGLSAYQELLSVSLIATPRTDFVTCAPTHILGDVRELARDGGFDFVPVESAGAIIAILDLRAAVSRGTEESVMSCWDPLAEKHLVGADTSILDFIEQAHEHPFRLLVTHQGISGLVSISDIQQLASRAALFALVTQLELTMARVIRKRSQRDEWKELLAKVRLDEVIALWERARKSSRQVDLLSYTQFCDKTTVIRQLVSFEELGVSKTQFPKNFERFRRLRDDLAHANEIEASEKTCKTVKSMRDSISKLEAILQ